MELGPLNEEKQGALETYKEKLISPHISIPPRKNGYYTSDTHAVDKQVGCEILQKHSDGVTKPIGCRSRILTD